MNPKIKLVLRVSTLVALLCLFSGAAFCAVIPRAGQSPAELAKRISDLEAYIRNTAPSADGALAGSPGPGHNGWLMTSSALVLFMTLPGLALFYGGLVRSKNVLSVLAQCLGIAGLVTILWWAVGYSLVFGRTSTAESWAGPNTSSSGAWIRSPNADYAYWISQNVFAMFQLMFAIITPALIVGAIAERMKFSAVLLFVAAWMLVVYFPLAHMVLGGHRAHERCVQSRGSKSRRSTFAGGTVVHMSSGWSALVLCMILGPRLGSGRCPCPRTAWCSAWSAQGCSGWAGMALTPGPRSERTGSPPTRSRPLRWQRPSPSVTWSGA